MMKKYLVAVAILCTSIRAFAQTPDTTRHRFSLHLGGAFPTGDFNHNRFEEAYPPFAQVGSMLQAGYAYTLRPHLELGLSAGWRSHRFNLDAFAAPDDELVREKKARAWQTVFVLTDVYVQTGGAKGVTFYTKGSVGAAHNRSASLHLQTDFGTIEHAADKAASLAWGVAGGVRVEVRGFGLIVEPGLFATAPTFERTDRHGNTTRYKQQMNSLHFTTGIFYTL